MECGVVRQATITIKGRRYRVRKVRVLASNVTRRGPVVVYIEPVPQPELSVPVRVRYPWAVV